MSADKAWVTFQRTVTIRKVVDRNEDGYWFDTIEEAIELDRGFIAEQPDWEFAFGQHITSEEATVVSVEPIA